MTTPFESEARAMASEEHFALSHRLEEMRADSTCTWQDIVWWKRDERWEDTPEEFYKTNRDHWLEEARVLHQENAA